MSRPNDSVRGPLRRGAAVAGFSLIVALALGIARGGTTAQAGDGWALQMAGMVRGGDWLQQLVYAEAIGLSIWASIDFGRRLFRPDPETHWPTGWRAIALPVGASASATSWARGSATATAAARPSTCGAARPAPSPAI